MTIYTPKVFVEPDANQLLELIDTHPFGLLVVSDERGELEMSHLPFLLDRGAGSDPHRLRVHVARANRIWQRALVSTRPITIVFSGPDAYVSPRWYAQPTEHVPTWNYAVVHAHGRASGPMAREELASTLARLAARHEADVADPWSLDQLDPAFRDELFEAIVGFTITVERLEGKFKLSQNRDEIDREGVLRGLAARGSDDDRAMLALMSPSRAR